MAVIGDDTDTDIDINTDTNKLVTMIAVNW